MNVEVLRTFKIELPEPIIIKCVHCEIEEAVKNVYLDEDQAKQLYLQLAKEFDSQ